jgi:hypothetical protein
MNFVVTRTDLFIEFSIFFLKFLMTLGLDKPLKLFCLILTSLSKKLLRI